VLFLHGMRLHPDLVPHRPGILHAVLSAFGGCTLAALWQGTGDTPDAELFALGFKKVAGQPLLARHSTWGGKWDDANPAGRDVDFVATPDHERWMNTKDDRDQVPPEDETQARN